MDPFVEIEIGGKNGNGERVPEKLPVVDTAHRARFNQMRELARSNNYPRLDYNNVFYSNDQRALLSEIFLRQAIFMEDFTDDYEKFVPFSSYYPVYQMMSYDQLRTYFTWRMMIRFGIDSDIYFSPASVSYAFVYVYELINQIGTGGIENGLKMLTDFYSVYRKQNSALDKHMDRWLKDYRIYYDIDTAGENKADRFDLLAGISGYKTNPDNLFREAVTNTVDRLAGILTENRIDINALLFPTNPTRFEWVPFSHALFVPDANRPDSFTIYSYDEIYICRRQKWTCRPAKNGNRKLMGYIFKQTDGCLRKLTGGKRSPTVKLDSLDADTLRILQVCGIHLDSFIENETARFYAEKNRIVVTVDSSSLEKIREEAQLTQEKLTVPEEKDEPAKVVEVVVLPETTGAESDPWDEFLLSLTDSEKEALRIICGSGDFKAFADSIGLMAEVLADGINQKAFDSLGDSVLEYDGQAEIYEEYDLICKSYLQSESRA